MNVLKYSSSSYRNLKEIEIFPAEGINVIYGENGQGKTNLIESIWIFTGCHSFRTHRINELIERGKSRAEIELDFFASGREQKAQLKIDNKREVEINGIAQKSPRALLGLFNAVVFSPSTLSIIKEGPAERRKFLDIAISLTKPVYASQLSKYLKIVAQRNALLKQIAAGRFDTDILSPWDEQLAVTGAKIIDYRVKYINNLSKVASEIYDGIAQGKETMSLSYIQSTGVENDEASISQTLYDNLEKSRKSDIKRLTTGVGPHKDDLDIKINQMSARSYGSQGQQRSCALALKLGEASILKNVTGEQPVALLDDVMSELDSGRQNYLFKYLNDWQVFITCCDPTHLIRLKGAKAFEVKNGVIKEMN
jgi:DNA replication and repair protein RecF